MKSSTKMLIAVGIAVAIVLALMPLYLTQTKEPSRPVQVVPSMPKPESIPTKLNSPYIKEYDLPNGSG
ncbi:MAG: hypothetical protein ACRD32_02380, partial [Nitrososphaerales archaeon]